MKELVVSIPERPAFYSLYSDGMYSYKVFSKERNASLISYAENAVVFLFYTYPAHREACAVRNTFSGTSLLPGLSKNVTLLFSVTASRVDKLRRALGFLNKHAEGAYRFNDGFYIRLYYTLLRRGKLDCRALRRLALESAGL